MTEEMANNKQMHAKKILEAENKRKDAMRKIVEEKTVTKNGKALKRIKYSNGDVKQIYLGKAKGKKKSK